MVDGRKSVCFDVDYLIFGDEEISLEYQSGSLTSRFVRNLAKKERCFTDSDKRESFLGKRRAKKDNDGVVEL